MLREKLDMICYEEIKYHLIIKSLNLGKWKEFLNKLKISKEQSDNWFDRQICGAAGCL